MSTYKMPLVNDNRPVIADAGIYADIQFDPSDATPTYIGLNLTKGESDSALTWKIYKFTYDSGDTTRIQLAYGAWSNRASLF